MTRANDSDAADGRPAVAILRPVRQCLPVVVSSPHSGRLYDPAFLAMSRLDAMAIRRYEDAFVDELVARAGCWIGQGVSILGGCCGLGPEHIAALSAAREDLQKAQARA